ncbi:hypothetical protein DPEC_G00006110 [Dallia pectoralis]|uniref:Uncharacterized protein n=1 Tax=Dallia pectoralis TaxID=75939 RepID=A0ACC2HJX8_DALPE|nr:hypothetical protein DPEC_G00006110 [Dallia pectoralis]
MIYSNAKIFRDYKEIGVDIYLAGCQVCVVEQLSQAGVFCESIPKSCLFATVHDAVLHSTQIHEDKGLPSYDYALNMSSTTKL